MMTMDELEPVQLVIDGTLDLHTFQPQDIKRLIPDYIALCLEQEIYELRIIHGKGKGTLRRIVHAALSRIPVVDNFALAPENAGGWGATLVSLKIK